MKNALSLISFVAGNVMIAAAQTTITVNTGGVAGQGQVNAGALFNLLNVAQQLVNRLVPFAIGVAVVSFFWFLIKFIVKGGDSSDEKNLGMKGMGYSLLALFVMVSIWGIVGAFGSMLGIGQGGSVPIPGVPVPTN